MLGGPRYVGLVLGHMGLAMACYGGLKRIPRGRTKSTDHPSRASKSTQNITPQRGGNAVAAALKHECISDALPPTRRNGSPMMLDMGVVGEPAKLMMRALLFGVYIGDPRARPGPHMYVK